jgi:signal transduction histidine kinase
MKSLVEEMLTLARADNMAPAAPFTEVSLSDVAADCALAFEPVAFEAGKGLEYEITEGVTVSGDPDKLRRLISVLLDNAVKYGSGTVRLSLQKTDRQARLTVSNPGDPIPPEQLEHLFERFYRADASRGEKTGFGLGLSIAETVAEEHKGTLRAESDTVSTRFTFTMLLKK